jgi:hypothetical protein
MPWVSGVFVAVVVSCASASGAARSNEAISADEAREVAEERVNSGMKERS